MVLQKRLYYGFNGFQAPVVPRGSRSARGRQTAKKNIKQNQMHAFELLATVAGKLLLEEKNPLYANLAAGEFKSPRIRGHVKQEKHELELAKPAPCDHGNFDGCALPSNVCNKKVDQKFPLKECSQASNSVFPGPSFAVKSETCGKNIYKSVIGASKDDIKDSVTKVLKDFSLQIYSPNSAGSHVIKVEDEPASPLQADDHKGEKGMGQNVADFLCTEDLLESDIKPPTLVSSDNSLEIPRGEHRSCNNSFGMIRNDTVLKDRDGDENSTWCIRTSSVKAFRHQRRGDGRKRKVLASKVWKVGPTMLKDLEFSKIETRTKSVFRSRKICYTRQRTQRSPLKRRRPFKQSSTFTQIGEISSEPLSPSPEKNIKGEGQKSHLKSDDYKVKFRIKSFKLPELSFEMPESATVGELKRAVLETITARLCNGLQVGVIHKGKKVRDDSKTLLQTGISHGTIVDNLGFYLEPNSSQIPQFTVSQDQPYYLDHCDARKPLSWLPPVPSTIEAQPDQAGPSIISKPTDSEQNLVFSANTVLPDKMTRESSALVTVPTATMDALSAVPVHRKSKQSGFVQRRTRRPFSVSEVEALVQTVEKLGTGRWRDVKSLAFDNANHRTYVDLKDKWKTLVHTARISPQQRRGEPVPQQLLDRVLSAHAYWSQQQAKRHCKQQPDECLLL